MLICVLRWWVFLKWNYNFKAHIMYEIRHWLSLVIIISLHHRNCVLIYSNKISLNLVFFFFSRGSLIQISSFEWENGVGKICLQYCILQRPHRPALEKKIESYHIYLFLAIPKWSGLIPLKYCLNCISNDFSKRI